MAVRQRTSLGWVQHCFPVALVALAVATVGLWHAEVLASPELDAGFRPLYEVKPAEAHTQFDAWQISHPRTTPSSEGINVNVTVLFGLPRYRQVVEAYIASIEARAAQGKPVKYVTSVASFFISRIDALVDPLLENSRRRGSAHRIGQRKNLRPSSLSRRAMGHPLAG